jgi:hypothetical protein
MLKLRDSVRRDWEQTRTERERLADSIRGLIEYMFPAELAEIRRLHAGIAVLTHYDEMARRQVGGCA